MVRPIKFALPLYLVILHIILIPLFFFFYPSYFHKAWVFK